MRSRIDEIASQGAQEKNNRIRYEQWSNELLNLKHSLLIIDQYILCTENSDILNLTLRKDLQNYLKNSIQKDT